jgi:hypothetical protein
MAGQEHFPLLSYREQLRHTGSTDQLYSVRRLQVSDGGAAGIKLIEVCTAGGLRALFCESRALDLLELHFRGINLGFFSKNGLLGGRVLPLEGEFTPTWPGGMLATCGLRNTGPDCRCDGEYHPLHGRIGGMAAEHISIDLDPERGTLIISGQMRESALFGYHLILHRRITVSLTGERVDWLDTVENCAAEPEPIFLLYHFNFGYPFLSPDLQLHLPPGHVLPRTEASSQGLAEFDQISEPVDGYAEQVFFHQALAGSGPDMSLRLVRPGLRLSAVLNWSRDELPVLVQWKSMKSGDYALGIEPSTSKIRGRAAELADGYDQILEPFGRRVFRLGLELVPLT